MAQRLHQFTSLLANVKKTDATENEVLSLCLKVLKFQEPVRLLRQYLSVDLFSQKVSS